MKTIKQLAEQLSDAYSTNAYNNGWSGCVRMLRARRFNDKQIEAIIRSKWTRWAADRSDKPYGRVTSADLSRFLDGTRNLLSEVDKLTRETFEQEVN